MFEGIIRALAMPFREAIDFFRGKVLVPTRRWGELDDEAHGRAFTVAGAMTEALLSDFKREVDRALEQGMTLNQFVGQFDEIVERHGWDHSGEPGWRARLIYETNLRTAFSAGRYEQMTEPDTLRAFPFWQYNHSGNPNFREEHKAWDGLVLRADDPFWNTHYPPNGWHCGCFVTVVSRRGLARLGKQAPDAAPKIEYRTVLDKPTGKTRQVPEGIDPGFAFNPGLVWKRGRGR